MPPLVVPTLDIGIMEMFDLTLAGIQARAWKISVPETTLVWTVCLNNHLVLKGIS